MVIKLSPHSLTTWLCEVPWCPSIQHIGIYQMGLPWQSVVKDRPCQLLDGEYGMSEFLQIWNWCLSCRDTTVGASCPPWDRRPLTSWPWLPQAGRLTPEVSHLGWGDGCWRRRLWWPARRPAWRSGPLYRSEPGVGWATTATGRVARWACCTLSPLYLKGEETAGELLTLPLSEPGAATITAADRVMEGLLTVPDKVGAAGRRAVGMWWARLSLSISPLADCQGITGRAARGSGVIYGRE